MIAADEDRQEPRTAGSLNADDLGREVTVPAITGEFVGADRARGFFVLLLPDGTERQWPIDTPVHVHDEEAGR